DEARAGGERARDLHAATLPARERDRGRGAQVTDVQVVEQRLQARSHVLGIEALQLQDRPYVLLDRELAEDRRLLRQVRQAQARAAEDRQAREVLAVEHH